MNETIGGSFRNKQYELYIQNRIKYLFPNTKPRILDVGVGAGKYGILLQDYASAIDGVEAYAAAVAFKKGIKAAPYLRNNYLNLANIYLMQKRPYEALQQIVAALDIKERFIMWADDGDAGREKPYVLAFHCFMAMDLKDQAAAMISKIEEINKEFELLPELRKLL